jgi:alcohol dehydrogenase (cytochrome c)
MKPPLFLLSLFLCLTVAVRCQPGATAPGQAGFEANCGTCHGGDGLGGEMGPSIANRLPNLSDDQLSVLLRDGLPSRGMPGFPQITGAEKAQLITFLRTIRPKLRPDPVSSSVTLADGKKLSGLLMNESATDLQMLTPDNRIHLLRPAAGGTFREVTSQADWSTYNGNTSANRFSTLTQITLQNVPRVVPKWVFTMEGATSRGQTTPLVVEGMMYVSSANECWALDAGSGRAIWHFQRPRTAGLIGNATQGMNRGVARLGDRIFMVTDNAHLLALNRFTGDVIWENEMADWHQNYNATSAPLVVNNLVVSGTAGGEQGVRGFIAAWDPQTGKEVWRFWTVPLPGEPGSETWRGRALQHPAAVSWLTGSYDPELDMLYWATGNPGPDYNGDEREGDNLYSDSIVALDPHTGKMKWYYQTTPHDVHDWDATEPLVLIDREWQGAGRKLLIQANRNGFFYVLDRETGKLLYGKAYLENINWAREVDAKGRPILLPLKPAPGSGSPRVCPWVNGATNWFSTAYDPATGHYYVQTFDACGYYTPRPAGDWEAGRGYTGGWQRSIPEEPAREILRALDVTTGKIIWEMPEAGVADSWGGVLGFSSGVLFVAGNGGMFRAVDTGTGRQLWQFDTSAQFKASPMTYVFDGRQYVAVNAGQNIIAFGLPEQ